METAKKISPDIWEQIRSLRIQVALLEKKLAFHNECERRQWREILGDPDTHAHEYHKPGLRMAVTKDLIELIRGSLYALHKERGAINRAVLHFRAMLRRREVTDEDIKELEQTFAECAKIPEDREVRRFIDTIEASVWNELQKRAYEGWAPPEANDG